LLLPSPLPFCFTSLIPAISSLPPMVVHEVQSSATQPGRPVANRCQQERRRMPWRAELLLSGETTRAACRSPLTAVNSLARATASILVLFELESVFFAGSLPRTLESVFVVIRHIRIWACFVSTTCLGCGDPSSTPVRQSTPQSAASCQKCACRPGTVQQEAARSEIRSLRRDFQENHTRRPKANGPEWARRPNYCVHRHTWYRITVTGC
jgi:hypothetical protein